MLQPAVLFGLEPNWVESMIKKATYAMEPAAEVLWICCEGILSTEMSQYVGHDNMSVISYW